MVALKMCGCMLLAAAGTGTGLYLSLKLSERREQLSQLIQGMELLISEISCSRQPLKAVFFRTSLVSCGAAALLFSSFSKLLEERDSEGASALWRQAVCHVFPGSGPLKSRDREVLLALGNRMGMLDVKEQCLELERAVRELSVCFTEAASEAQTKGRVFRTAGTAAGLLAAVLFL